MLIEGVVGLIYVIRMLIIKKGFIIISVMLIEGVVVGLVL